MGGSSLTSFTVAEGGSGRLRMVDHMLEGEKDGLVVGHLLGKLMCQLLNHESQKSELVVYEGLKWVGSSWSSCWWGVR